MEHPQPAFALDFDPLSVLLNEGSVDNDFDKVLSELDLELATDTTSKAVGQTLGLHKQPGSSSSDAGGLRELFGVQQSWGMQQPPQQQLVGQAAEQQQQQQLYGQNDAQPDMQQQQQALLQQQQQQQLLLQQQLQQQQQLPVVYQLPSPFVQPVAALTPSLPLQGLGGMYAGMQPAQLLEQQQFLLAQAQAQVQQQQLLQAQQQQLFANGVQQQSPSAPVFTFHALPAHLQQQQQNSDASVSAADGSAGAPDLLALAAAWPQYAAAAGQASSTLGPMSPHAWAASAGLSPAGAMFSPAAHSVLTGDGAATAGPAVAAAAPARRGRGRGAAAAAAGADKPKAPSQRFRERQKATISSLEAEVTAKLAELQVLSQENEMLKLRSAVLEAVTSGREYHMRVIKEHGPPSFDVAGSSPAQLSGGRSGSIKSSSEQQQTSATASGDSPRSGSLNSSSTGSAATAAAAAAAIAAGAASADAMATDDASPSTAAGAAAAAAAGDDDVAAAADDVDAAAVADDPLQCGARAGACTLGQSRSSIHCIRQMKASDIIMHWRQFLQDVSEELLMSDDRDEQQRLEAGKLGLQASGLGVASHFSCSGHSSKTQAHTQTQTQQQDDTSDDSGTLLGLSKVCRWCGCTNTEGLHLPGGCSSSAADMQQQELQQAAAAAAGGGDAAGATARDARLVELVNKYSYMTKFVALLNPGVLYSLLGRNLDTGEAAPYTDEHWRGVVTRLHLTTQQVTYVTACAELYFSSLCSLMHERQALHAALVQADGALSECQRRLLGVDGTLDQLTVLERLSSNLKKEHVLRIMLNCFVWGRILTAVQFAKTAVYSHPFFPDVHALVCVIYEDAYRSTPGEAQPAGRVFPHRIAAAKAALAKAPAMPRTTAAAQAALSAAPGSAAGMAVAG